MILTSRYQISRKNGIIWCKKRTREGWISTGTVYTWRRDTFPTLQSMHQLSRADYVLKTGPVLGNRVLPPMAFGSGHLQCLFLLFLRRFSSGEIHHRLANTNSSCPSKVHWELYFRGIINTLEQHCSSIRSL